MWIVSQFFRRGRRGMQNMPCWIKPSKIQAVGCVGANSYCNDGCRSYVPRQPGRGRRNRWSGAQVGATAQSSFRSSQASLLGFIVVCREKWGCMFGSSLTSSLWRFGANLSQALDTRRLLECLVRSCRLVLPCRKQIGGHHEARVFPSDGSWFAHAGL